MCHGAVRLVELLLGLARVIARESERPSLLRFAPQGPAPNPMAGAQVTGRVLIQNRSHLPPAVSSRGDPKLPAYWRVWFNAAPYQETGTGARWAIATTPGDWPLGRVGVCSANQIQTIAMALCCGSCLPPRAGSARHRNLQRPFIQVSKSWSCADGLRHRAFSRL